MVLERICSPGQCEFIEFLNVSGACYSFGGMKCRKYDRIVVRYDPCLDSKVEKLEKKEYTEKCKEN